MPGSTPERQKMWSDERGFFSDEKAIKHLKDRGYKLTHDWFWELPTKDHEPSPDEEEAMIYLIEEWDMGGYTKE